MIPLGTRHKLHPTQNDNLVARISDTLAEMDARLRQLQQEKRRCSCLHQKHTTQSSRTRLKGLRIATLAFTHDSCVISCYVQYLQHTLPSTFTETEAEVAEAIETYVLSLDVDVLASWLDWV